MHAAILYDDRIPTGGHSKSAGNRTVSCAALERALNSPDLSTFFFGGVNPTNARGPWAPPSWFLQPLIVCRQIRFTVYQAPTTLLAERIFQLDFFFFWATHVISAGLNRALFVPYSHGVRCLPTGGATHGAKPLLCSFVPSTHCKFCLAQHR
jgi:hypothetical protein